LFKVITVAISNLLCTLWIAPHNEHPLRSDVYEYKFYMPSTEFYRTEPTFVSLCIQYIQFHALNILLLHGVHKNITPAEKNLHIEVL